MEERKILWQAGTNCGDATRVFQGTRQYIIAKKCSFIYLWQFESIGFPDRGDTREGNKTGIQKGIKGTILPPWGYCLKSQCLGSVFPLA